LRFGDEPGPGRYTRTLTADAQGIVKLVGLPLDGRFVLDAAPPEDRPDLRPTRVAEWTPSDEAVTLTPGFVIRGVVRDPNGRPVSGASVAAEMEGASGQSVESRSDGRFTVGGLPEGEAKLRATKAGDFGGESQVATVRAGTEGVVLVVHPGAELVVRIEGWPSASAWEWIHLVDQETGVSSRWTRVMADGTATFRGCNAVTTYSLTVRLDEPPRVGVLRDLRAGQGPARLALGPGREITGTVKAPPGAVDVEAYVTGTNFWASGTVDAEGKLRVPALPDGEWKVVVTAQVAGQAWTAEADVAAGASVDLVLKAAAPPAPGTAPPPSASCGDGKCG